MKYLVLVHLGCCCTDPLIQLLGYPNDTSIVNVVMNMIDIDPLGGHKDKPELLEQFKALNSSFNHTLYSLIQEDVFQPETSRPETVRAYKRIKDEPHCDSGISGPKVVEAIQQSRRLSR